MGLIRNSIGDNPIDVSLLATHLPTNTDEELAKLQFYLDTAVDYFELAGNLCIRLTEYTQTETNLGTAVILARSPVTEVTGFQVLTNGVWEDFTDYTVDFSRPCPFVWIKSWPTLDCESPNVRIDYTAGHETSSGSGSSGLSPLLVRGVLALATHYYDQRGVIGDDTELPFGVQTILSLFRNANA